MSNQSRPTIIEMVKTMTTNEILAAFGWTKRPAGRFFDADAYDIINEKGEIVHTGDALSTSRFFAKLKD